ncbi:VOC family protein [Chitinophaga alhagiae]|uniref:VOC family protein n=1 Tax=Chitinophaga alhagiae TaxID=2203219 RepID=UPI000E5C07EF|nr:VOC family protein [Chitinophaga alhagiae]
MKKHFLGLRTAIYKVPDVAAGKEWYTRAFNAAPYFDEPFYVGFEIGGFELGLQPLAAGEAHPGPGGVEVYWGVEDMDAEYQRLLSLGATPHFEPRNVGGPIMVAVVKDPWNNLLGLIYNPLFEAK